MFMIWAINPGAEGLRKEFPSVDSLSLGHSVWKGLYIMVVFSSLYIHFINARILHLVTFFFQSALFIFILYAISFNSLGHQAIELAARSTIAKSTLV